MKRHRAIPGLLFLSLVAACSGSSAGTNDGDAEGDGGAHGGDAGLGNGADADGGSKNDGGGGKEDDTLGASVVGSVALAAGGTTSLAVTITRGGWDADVVVATSGLPAGITAEPLTIAKGASSASLVLHAAASAAASATPFEVDASGDGLVAKASSKVSIGKQAIDSSFGVDGFVTAPVSDVEAFVVEDDGRVILYGADRSAGVYELVGLDASGALDPAFGVKGIVSLPAGNTTFGALARQPDGKIVFAYTPDAPVGGAQAVAVLRFDAHGGVDTTFGSSGKTRLDVGTCNQASASGTKLAIATDGKILAGTSIGCDDASGDHAFQDIAIARVGTNGTLDASFGSGGTLTLTGSTTYTTFLDGLGGDDGSLVVRIDRHTQPGADDAYLVQRYDADGKTLDPAFSFAKRPIGWQSQPGKGYLWGRYDIDQNTILSRALTTGNADTGFGGSGTGSISAPPFAQDDFVNGGAVRFGTTKSGSIWEAHWNTPKKGIEIWSYSADGARDLAYGTAGRVSVPFTAGSRTFQDGVAGADGRLIVLTSTEDGDSVLVRFFL